MSESNETSAESQLREESAAPNPTPGTTQPAGSSRSGALRRPHSVPIPPAFEAKLDADLWGDLGVDPETAPPQALATEVVFLIELWKRDRLRARALWGHARQALMFWTAADFARLPTPVLTYLTGYLQANGVWISLSRPLRNRGIKSARLGELIYAAIDGKYHTWADAEIADARSEYHEFRSNLAWPDFLPELTLPDDEGTPAPAPTATPPPAAALPQTSGLAQPRGYPQPRAPDIDLTPAPKYIPPSERQQFKPLALSESWPRDPARLSTARTLPPVSQEMPTPRMISDLAKQYDDSMKYGGELYDMLDSKLAIFRDTCSKAGMAPEQYAGAFSVMLKSRAREYYYQHILPRGATSLDTMIDALRQKFETQETKFAYLAAWRDTTLAKVIQDNPGKTTLESLDLLIDRLDKLALAIGAETGGAGGLRMQLLSACRGHPACRLAQYAPASTYDAVIAQLRSAIGTEESEATHSYVTDRTYRGDGRANRYGNGRGRPRAAPPGRRLGTRPLMPSSPKVCYVCKKPGCWSSNHPKEEIDKAYAAFRATKAAQGISQKRWTTFVSYYEDPGAASEEAQVPQHSEEEALAFFLTHEDELTPQSADEDSDSDPEDSPRTLTWSSHHYLTEAVDPAQAAAALINGSVGYALTGVPQCDSPQGLAEAEGPPSTFSLEGRYTTAAFQGIMPDTGAAEISTAGLAQFRALQRQMEISLDESAAGEAQVRFGPGQPVASLGTTTVPTALGDLRFHVMPTPTPFLLCLQDMDANGIIFDNLANLLRRGDLAVPVIRKWGHAWMPLHAKDALAYCHLTEGELRRLHRRFGHPSVARLHGLLRKAGHDVEARALAEIERVCRNCQLHAAAPLRFKFTIHDDCEFNHEVLVDIFYLEGNLPVLHVVDKATAFNAARFLPEVTAAATWAALRECWIDTYLGPPDWITTDAGSQFHAAEFHAAARTLDISINEVPVEAHHSIGKVERYHAPLRRAYNILRKEDPTSPKEASLQAAVKAVNDTAGPRGLVPTLLVFGAYPRISDTSPPSPAITQRAAAMSKAMAALRKAAATRQVSAALAARNGPAVAPAALLPLQSQVRVFRGKKGWRGPYRLIGTSGEDVTVETARGPRVFRSTVVKPFYTDPADALAEGTGRSGNGSPAGDPSLAADRNGGPAGEASLLPPTLHSGRDSPPVADEIIVAAGPPPATQDQADEPTPPPPRRPRGRPRKTAVAYLQETDITGLYDTYISTKEAADLALADTLRAQGKITTPGAPFEASTQAEIDALIERGVFEFVAYNPEAHARLRIFKSRIVNEVKNKATDAPYEKSRLVIQGYADAGKEVILTQAPTIQRASQRLILALAPSLLLRGFYLWLRDITQAYVQSATKLNRPIYAHLPAQIQGRYPPRTIMRVIKPLYGIAEAGTHWYGTYSSHHKERLHMETSTYDPCLLVTTASTSLFGCVGMQTDDTLGLSDPEFSALEDQALAEAAFTAKPKTTLAQDTPLMFNGGIVTLADDKIITIRQKGQGQRLATVDPKAPAAEAKQQYVEQRARAAYIASICQPEACFDLSRAAQQQDPSPEDIKGLNRRLEWQMANPDRGLTYLPLDLATAALFVFVDGSFANNQDLTSQLGFVIILANETAHPAAAPRPAAPAAAGPASRGDTFTIRGNIIHYSSTKCKRVTRSVLASEVYGMVAGVDIAYTLATTLAQITGQLGLPTIPTIVCTDSYSLYECLVKLGTTKEKRLMIDILALRQSYERRELLEIRWINGEDNPADALTKAAPNTALERFVSNSELEVRMEGWVTRA